MLKKEGIDWNVYCDRCGKRNYPNSFIFKNSVSTAKKNGWKAYNTPFGWYNYCPECDALNKKENNQLEQNKIELQKAKKRYDDFILNLTTKKG